MFRRQFIKQTGITTLGLGIVAAVPMDVLASIRKKVSPNDKIGVGLIGCKGMGWNNLTSMLKMSEVQCVALCDIDDNVLEQRKVDLAKISQSPTIYKDYRKLLEQKDVAIVIIATPDHWHCLMMIDACAAGKHILLEKPASNTIAEAQLMVNAAQRHNSIVQVNQWQRSQQHFKDAIAFVHSGKLGHIAQTKTWMYNGHQILPVATNGPVPDGVDYNMWLGPAPNRPFNPNRFHYNFRWYWDYAGGLMTDWGVHLIDMVILGMKADLPQSVVSMGGHIAYPADARETPDTQTALYTYKDFQLSWEHTMGRQYGPFGMGHGIAFIGSNGTLLLNRGGWEVRPEKEKGNPRMEEMAWQKQVDNGLDMHTKNLIDAIKAGDAKLLNCPIEAGANTAIHCHMGNIALRSGQTLQVSNNNGISFNNKLANKLITPKYSNGWRLPKI
jgi:predicted dehydrogenase